MDINPTLKTSKNAQFTILGRIGTQSERPGLPAAYGLISVSFDLLYVHSKSISESTLTKCTICFFCG